jgi:hypothetical protein
MTRFFTSPVTFIQSDILNTLLALNLLTRFTMSGYSRIESFQRMTHIADLRLINVHLWLIILGVVRWKTRNILGLLCLPLFITISANVEVTHLNASEITIINKDIVLAVFASNDLSISVEFIYFNGFRVFMHFMAFQALGRLLSDFNFFLY